MPSRLPEPARLRPRNTMDGSGVASSVQCLHYDHPMWLGTCNDTYPRGGFVLREKKRVEREGRTMRVKISGALRLAREVVRQSDP